MATLFAFSRGATASFLFAFTRDGAACDISGATLSALVKSSVLDTDSAALATLDGVVIIDGPAGTAQVTFAPADTAALRMSPPLFFQLRATLTTGDVIAPDAFQGPLVFKPLRAPSYEQDDDPTIAGIAAILSPDGTASYLPAALSNFVCNRYDLTGLYGGATTDLDGLSALTLAALANGAALQIFFAGRILAQYRLRAMVGTEVDTPTTGRIVVCDNAPTRLWELESVAKEGIPCTWDEVAQLWCQLTGYGGATALLPGFSLPA